MTIEPVVPDAIVHVLLILEVEAQIFTGGKGLPEAHPARRHHIILRGPPEMKIGHPVLIVAAE